MSNRRTRCIYLRIIYLTEQELNTRLCGEYEVDAETAEKDIKEFLDHIRKYEIVLQE